MVIDGGRGLEMSLEPLCKISCWLTNIFFITFHPVAFVSIYDSLFFMMVSLSLGAIRRFLIVNPPFRCICTPCLLHVLLKFSLRPWWYGTTICGWLMLSCSGLVGLVPLLLFLLEVSFGFLSLTLFRVQVGYLHLFKAEGRCCSSFCRCWGEEHMVLALWNKVPKTLYFDGILWWLSHCKYKSVWVGFL